MKKIPYAGYDPDEERRGPLDKAWVKRLKSEGLTLKEIGERIAVDRGREMAYTVDYIQKALRRRE